MFRLLKPNEIECRVQSIKPGKNENADKAYIILLLYKDARCDMRILDECVGSANWQRKHGDHKGNLFCSVGIYDNDKKEWIWKEDAGAESNTEAEKGHASDSFKRACVNWGIGRELYTAPFIYMELLPGEFYRDTKGNLKVNSNVKFYVDSIKYKDDEIKELVIVDKKGNERFRC